MFKLLKKIFFKRPTDTCPICGNKILANEKAIPDFLKVNGIRGIYFMHSFCYKDLKGDKNE